MMTDIENAENALEGHSLALCRDGEIITSDLRGVAPMLFFLDNNTNLAGFSAADLIVGKAAAMLFVKAGIKEVYARVMSESGLDFLIRHGIECSYGTLCEKIINRDKTDICPMEKAVADVDDIDEGIERIKNKLSFLRSMKK